MKISATIFALVLSSVVAAHNWDERCPTGELLTDCSYTSCLEEGCASGQICCPKPCGGSRCIDLEEKNSTDESCK
ncbi:hypothetical protein E5D57_009480 [Metarhizium anisopliae]|nr:hypothetical protein E5D57_009480 [Metarhizium anisopliae]